jgi:hypothetical protein
VIRTRGFYFIGTGPQALNSFLFSLDLNMGFSGNEFTDAMGELRVPVINIEDSINQTFK